MLNIKQNEILQKIIANHKSSLFKKQQSFYIYGKTGCGKTTIINKFLAHLQNKQKVLYMHFHDYFLDIIKLLTTKKPKEIVKEIAKNHSILCFDEFFIESVVDAKILYDIFSELFKYKICIVITSNFHPKDLYKDGFNREYMFPKFSDMIEKNMNVFELIGEDYRKRKKEKMPIYFKTIKTFEEVFNKKISFEKKTLEVDKNHFIEIHGTFENGIVLNYDDVLKKHTSIKDFRFIIKKFPHIHIHNMQTFSYNNEDEAIRFRNLIDIAYLKQTIVTFDGVKTVDFFAKEMLKNIKFMRCQSRLYEM